MKDQKQENKNSQDTFNLDIHKDKIIGEARRLSTPFGIQKDQQNPTDDFDLNFEDNKK